MRLVVLSVALLTVAGCAADAAEESESEFVTGNFQQIDGTDHLRADLTPTWGDYGSRSVSGSRGSGPSSVNVLFYDTDSREGEWLFPTSEQVIFREEVVRDSARVRAFVVVVVEEDTNGDDDLDAEDARSILIADPTGDRLTRIAEGVSRYRETVRLGADRVLVLFDAGSTVRGVEVGLEDGAVEARVTMPTPPADS